MNNANNNNETLFYWLVGSALPGNALSFCHYLFERENFELRPQFKSSLNTGQLYAAACRNLFNIEIDASKPFEDILRTFNAWKCQQVEDISRVVKSLALKSTGNEFSEPEHTSFIRAIMLATLQRLVSSSSIELEITRIFDTNEALLHPLSGGLSQENANGSPDLVPHYSHTLFLWLKAVAVLTIHKILKQKQLNPNRLELLLSRIGFVTLLSCAIYYYAPDVKDPPKSLENFVFVVDNLQNSALFW